MRKALSLVLACLVIVSAVGVVPSTAAASSDGSDNSPVDEIFGNSSATSGIPDFVADLVPQVAEAGLGIAKTAVSTKNEIGYEADALLSDEQDVTTPKQQADALKSFVNNNSASMVTWYANQNYPASSDWNVIRLTYTREDSKSHTDYLVLTYNSTEDQFTAAKIVDDTSKSEDHYLKMSGPLVHSYDEDKKDALGVVKQIKTEYVDTGTDIASDEEEVGELAEENAGHVESSLIED